MKSLPWKAIGLLVLLLLLVVVFAASLAPIPIIGPAAGFVSGWVRKIPVLGPKIPSI